MRKEPREHQLKAIALWAQSVNAGKKRPVIMAPTGAGKCQRFGTPILMADGTIKPVQDIRIGDRLASPTGIKTVLSLGSGEGEMYEVIPVKGDSYVVNADHLLSLKVTGGVHGMILSNGEKIEKGTTLINVRADVFYASNKTVKHCLKGWRSSIEHFDVQPVILPIPPYILGIWLGDGTVGGAAISKPEGEIVKAWLEYGRSIGCDVRKDSHDGRCPSWFLKTARGQPNPILDLLRNIGVLHNKHVPQDYLTASVADRLELIAGLLDTDGHVSHGGYDWISKDKILAENMAFLCRSIGLACYITPCKKGIKSTGFEGNYWRCSISGDCEKIPCRQKKAQPRKQIKNHLVTGIELKPVGIEKYYGFELDGDGLYMLGDFTVTHNTVLAAMLIEASLKINWRVAFVVPRLSLIDQTVQAFWNEGIRDVGVIQSNHALTDYSKPVQVASVQTIMRRALPDVDTVIVDECHMDFDFMHKWLAMPEWKDKIFTGLSATPWTKGLGKHWDDLLICCTTQELIDKKYLSPFRVFAIDHPDLTGVKTVAGDYHEGQLSEVMQDKTLLGHVVANWLKNGEDRPTLCFCVDCAHAQSLAAEFNKAGVPCGYQDAHTDAIERRLIADRFRKGEYRVVCSVGTLTTGVDWDVRCIILARPTKSEMLYVQMIGRGLRTADGKADCLIFDHADNTLRMGFVTDIHHTELDDGKNTKTVKEREKKEKLPKECSNCHYLKPAGVHACPQCGFAPVKQTEIVETHDELKEIGGKAVFSMREKQRFYSGLLYIARGRGYKPGWASWQYKKKFGVWPKGMVDIAELPLPDCAGWVKAQQIAYAKAKLK